MNAALALDSDQRIDMPEQEIKPLRRCCRQAGDKRFGGSRIADIPMIGRGHPCVGWYVQQGTRKHGQNVPCARKELRTDTCSKIDPQADAVTIEIDAAVQKLRRSLIRVVALQELSELYAGWKA